MAADSEQNRVTLYVPCWVCFLNCFAGLLEKSPHHFRFGESKWQTPDWVENGWTINRSNIVPGGTCCLELQLKQQDHFLLVAFWVLLFMAMWLCEVGYGCLPGLTLTLTFHKEVVADTWKLWPFYRTSLLKIPVVTTAISFCLCREFSCSLFHASCPDIK